MALEYEVQCPADLLAELLLLEWQQIKALDPTFQPEQSFFRWTNYAQPFNAALLEYQAREKQARLRYRAPTFAELSAGVLLGPYQICGSIGAGGMGDVYAADDTRLGRKVAIKILASHLTQNPAYVKRFAREAATVARLSHPNIVTLFDLGEVEVAGQSVSFVVMEFLEGETVRERLENDRMSVERAVHVAVEIAGALDASHRQSVVHRDIKPENIFLTADGRVKILDFGLARLGEEAGTETDYTPSQDALTQVGAVLGTTGYMAPEQVRGEAASAPSDLFSLTSVLFEMLFGRRAFPGQSRADMATATLRDDPLNQIDKQLQTDLPPALIELLHLGFQKQVEMRIQTAHEFSRRLAVIAADLANAQRIREDNRVRPLNPLSTIGPVSSLFQRWLIPVLFTVTVVVGTAWNYELPGSTSPAPAPTPPHTIAVLPFSSQSDVQSHAASKNLTVGLTDSLARDEALCVRPYSAVCDWNWNDASNMFDDARIERLKADLLVTGQVYLEDSTVRVRVELVNPAKGRLVWSNSYTASHVDLANLHLNIRNDVVHQLGGRSMTALAPSTLACGIAH